MSSPGNAWIGGFLTSTPCVRKPTLGKPGVTPRRRELIGNSPHPMPASSSGGFIHKFKHDNPLVIPFPELFSPSAIRLPRAMLLK